MSDDATRIVRTYDASKNPDGQLIMGVPMRDLMLGEWESFPDWIKQSIDACGFWTRPRGAPAAALADSGDTSSSNAA